MRFTKLKLITRLHDFAAVFWGINWEGELCGLDDAVKADLGNAKWTGHTGTQWICKWCARWLLELSPKPAWKETTNLGQRNDLSLLSLSRLILLIAMVCDSLLSYSFDFVCPLSMHIATSWAHRLVESAVREDKPLLYWCTKPGDFSLTEAWLKFSSNTFLHISSLTSMFNFIFFQQTQQTCSFIFLESVHDRPF